MSILGSATIYERGNFIYVFAQNETTLGLWLGAPPYERLAIDASDDGLGGTVLAALARSERGVPHPARNSLDDDRPLLRLAGVRSLLAFERGAKLVLAQLGDDSIVILPGLSLEPRHHGYGMQKDMAIRLSSWDAGVVGRAIRDALAIATVS